VFALNGRSIASTMTDTSARYGITGLTPMAASATTGYIVCFDLRPPGGLGYVPQCYDGITWNPAA
jgi:hypothetical protein